MIKEWDTSLATDAQALADSCTHTHSSTADRSNKHGFTYIGENNGYGSGESKYVYNDISFQ